MEQLTVDLQTSVPHPALRRFVHRYVQRRLAPGANLNEPITARLGALLEFHFAGLYRIPICGTDREEYCAPMLAVGPITYRRVQLHADGAVEAVTVIFQPCGLHELFSVPTHILAEHAIEAHSLLGTQISHLYASLGEARNFTARVHLLDKFLLTKVIARQRKADLLWMRVFTSMSHDREARNIGAIAGSHGVSVRQLERRSLEFTGMTPQTLIRVARFEHALELRRSATHTRPTTWTEIAHAVGYYDQMHLIREFRAMGGATPAALINQLEPHHGASLLLDRSFAF